MKQWTKQEFIDVVDSCPGGEKRINEYFTKHDVKTVSILTILNTPTTLVTRFEKQWLIWRIDYPLWERANPRGVTSGDPEVFAIFEQNIRRELKASK